MTGARPTRSSRIAQARRGRRDHDLAMNVRLGTVITQTDLLELLLTDGALTAVEIAAKLGISKRMAWAQARLAAQAGYLYRDEFGMFGTSCPWPRVGL
jgi:hypothetical protein